MSGRDASPARVFRVGRGRAVLVFWTAIGGALSVAGAVTYVAHAAASNAIQGQPALVVLGVLVVGYVQLVYPAVTWLTVGPDGFVLSTLPGRRAVPWARVGTMETRAALAPAARGGNLGGIRVRDLAGRLILIVPDVFVVKQEVVLLNMERARGSATPT